jgi:hypothetical protein
MSGPERCGATLDFLVIGAQKSGTTTLWDLLRDHPGLWLPATKEAPFFSHTPVYERGLRAHLASLGAPRDCRRLRGTVTPHYMHGWHDAPTQVIAARIAHDLPGVRLIAVLREPVARARSQHAMAAVRGHERRNAEQALREELAEPARSAARTAPNDTNTYVIQGEYGRILSEYLGVLPREALHVEWTNSLDTEPLGVLQRIAGFLSVSNEVLPTKPFRRLFVGGQRARVDPAHIEELLNEIEADPSAVGSATRRWLERERVAGPASEQLLRATERVASASTPTLQTELAGLRFMLTKTWNFLPSPPAPISDELQRDLTAHYRADGDLLARTLGIAPPWHHTQGTWLTTDIRTDRSVSPRCERRDR